ncbi:hypothetical protein STW0522CIT30_08150 [Citrobacter portucalensis]|nr:hypothetical protein STW0522CIT30_08150 [Citrobacter portucalensis]
MKKSFMPMKNMVLYYSFASPNTGDVRRYCRNKRHFFPLQHKKVRQIFPAERSRDRISGPEQFISKIEATSLPIQNILNTFKPAFLVSVKPTKMTPDITMQVGNHPIFNGR